MKSLGLVLKTSKGLRGKPPISPRASVKSDSSFCRELDISFEGELSIEAQSPIKEKLFLSVSSKKASKNIF